MRSKNYQECAIADCGLDSMKRMTLCSGHYQRYRRYKQDGHCKEDAMYFAGETPLRKYKDNPRPASKKQERNKFLHCKITDDLYNLQLRPSWLNVRRQYLQPGWILLLPV